MKSKSGAVVGGLTKKGALSVGHRMAVGHLMIAAMLAIFGWSSLSSADEPMPELNVRQIAGDGDKAEKATKKTSAKSTKVRKATKKRADLPNVEDVISKNPKKAPKVATATKTEGKRDMLSLIDTAVKKEDAVDVLYMEKKDAPQGKTISLEGRPEVPSRSAIKRAVGGTLPKARKCVGDSAVRGMAKLVVKNDGSVKSAKLIGVSASEETACIEKALSGARFPVFKRETFDVAYPVSVRALK